MRYFFDILDHGETIRDLEGTDLPDDAAAREEAVRTAREMMSDALLRGEPIDHRAFEIRGRHGELVERMPFMGAVPKGS